MNKDLFSKVFAVVALIAAAVYFVNQEKPEPVPWVEQTIERPTPTPTPAPTRKEKEDTAVAMSQLMVMDHLKAPSTAEFPLFSEASIKQLDAKTWRVSSYVDAQNSFGAMLRTRYTVTMEDMGGNWKLIDIKLQ